MKIKATLEKILSAFKVENGDKDKGIEVSTMSIEKKFYSQIMDYFSKIVDERSVGKSMVIHMGYIVWVEPSDYDVIKEELIVIVPEVIDGFYDIIRQKKEQYPKCMPGSTEWFFQITPTSVVPKDGTIKVYKNLTNLKKGEFVISSTFHSVNRVWSNVHQSSNVVLSYRPQNSNTLNDMNVNRDLLLGIEALGGAFSQRFDYAKAGIEVKKNDVYTVLGFGSIKFNSGNGIATYSVKDKSFFVSGSADKREQYNVLVLPDERVLVGHLAFRYKEEEDNFEVAAYGQTVMNDRLLKLSTIDEPIWYKVSAKASFLLASSIGLTFIQNIITNQP